ncbi:MAG: hypothetical protein RL308_2110 [Bacteroidota bacterium]|jgi:hypothetical protein
MKKIIPLFLFLTIAFTSQAQEKKAEVCDCPETTRMDFLILCKDVYERKPSSEESELSFKYEQALWRMSCAKEGVDDMETARKKIQCMWNKNRKSFSCDYPGSVVPKGNITKFSLETNFPEFLVTAAKRYKLDMNFKDPQDNRTILDFVKDQIAYMKKAPVNMTLKIQEYEDIYKMLQENGAKHGKDL